MMNILVGLLLRGLGPLNEYKTIVGAVLAAIYAGLEFYDMSHPELALLVLELALRLHPYLVEELHRHRLIRHHRLHRLLVVRPFLAIRRQDQGRSYLRPYLQHHQQQHQVVLPHQVAADQQEYQ